MHGVLWVGLVAGLSTALAVTGLRFDLDVKTSAVTLLVFGGLFYFFVRRAQARVFPADSGTILGRHSYEFGHAGIQESSEHTESLIRWSGVRELRETDTHFFIMVDRNAGCIIPKRDLTSPGAERHLKSLLTALIQVSSRVHR